MPWRFRSHILCWWGLEWICPESLYDLLVDDKEIQECGKASYREKKKKVEKLLGSLFFGQYSGHLEMRKFSEGKDLISQKWMIPLKPR